MAVPFPSSGVGTALTIAGPAVLFAVVVAEETGAAAARVNIIDGMDGNGIMLAPLPIESGKGRDVSFGPLGAAVQRGVCVVVAAGQASGVVYVLRQ